MHLMTHSTNLQHHILRWEWRHSRIGRQDLSSPLLPFGDDGFSESESMLLTVTTEFEFGIFDTGTEEIEGEVGEDVEVTRVLSDGNGRVERVGFEFVRKGLGDKFVTAK